MIMIMITIIINIIIFIVITIKQKTVTYGRLGASSSFVRFSRNKETHIAL